MMSSQTYASLFKLKELNLFEPSKAKLLKVIECRERKNILQTIKSMQKTESDFFCLDPCFSNILSYLLIKRDDEEDFQEAKTLSDSVLQREPKNILALCNKLEILKRQNRTSKTIKSQIQNASEDEMLVQESRVVVGYYLYRLAPRFLSEAVTLLEDAINQCDSNPVMKSKVNIWRYFLASAYSKCMGKDNFHYVSDFHPDEMFHKLRTSVMSVKEAEGHIVPPKCLVVMAETFEKYQCIPRPSDRIEKLPLCFNDTKHCFEVALEMSKDDPHILEKYGSFLRRKAIDETTLLQGVKVLKQVVAICPNRHVSWHQLSIAYKQLWWFEDQLDQRRLLCNQIRSGAVVKQTGLSRNARRRRNKKLRDSQLSESCEQEQKVPTERKAAYSRAAHQSKHNLKLSPFIPPNRPRDFTELPTDATSPDYFSTLKAQNPALEMNSEYFQKAMECLVTANEIVSETRLLYLIELARLHISGKKYELAYRLFRKAETKQIFKTYKDEAYLYEQWGITLLEENDYLDVTSTDTDISSDEENGRHEQYLNKSEQFLLKSVKMAVRINSKSCVAFHKLVDLLKKSVSQMNTKKSSRRRLTLAKLYELVGQREKAKDLFREEDEETAEWIEFCATCKDEKEAEKGLDILYTYGEKHQYNESMKKHVVELTETCVKQFSNADKKMDCYSETMRSLLGQKRMHSRSATDEEPRTKRQVESGACAKSLIHYQQNDKDEDKQIFFVCNNRTDMIESLYEKFESMDHIKVWLACENDNDDFAYKNKLACILDILPNVNLLFIGGIKACPLVDKVVSNAQMHDCKIIILEESDDGIPQQSNLKFDLLPVKGVQFDTIMSKILRLLVPIGDKQLYTSEA